MDLGVGGYGTKYIVDRCIPEYLQGRLKHVSLGKHRSVVGIDLIVLHRFRTLQRGHSISPQSLICTLLVAMG